MDIDEEIRKNNVTFHEMIENSDRFEGGKRVEKLYDAATHAVFHPIGQFASGVLEKRLLQIAQEQEVPPVSQQPSRGVLHVFTKVYQTGGHTRIVERWIQSAPLNEKHSVILLHQSDRNQVPELLKNVVAQRQGDFLDISAIGPFLEKALLLRQVAQMYDYVVLHVHMNDIVPMIAFGTEKFSKPVITMNHSDHLFWVGAGISDLVINLRQKAVKICEKYRKTRNHFILPLPVAEPNDFHSAMGNINDDTLPDHVKLVLSMASTYKYVKFGPYDFIDFVRKLLTQTENARFMVIGTQDENEQWKQYEKEFQGRFILSGKKDHGLLEHDFARADLIIDSFPVSSFTSVLDIAKYDKPALSLRTPVNALEIFEEAGIYCQTIEEMLERSVQILETGCPANQRLFPILRRDHFPEGFAGYLEKLKKQIPKVHQVFEFEDPEKEITEFERFVFQTPYIT